MRRNTAKAGVIPLPNVFGGGPFGVDPGARGATPPTSKLAARGFYKYQQMQFIMPAERRDPEAYASLPEWLAENPNPRDWARRMAREFLAESPTVREMGMSLGELTHWLAEHARKWKRMAEEQMAAEMPDSIGSNSGATKDDIVRSLTEENEVAERRRP